MILQEESHTIGLLSIQIEKYEITMHLWIRSNVPVHVGGGWVVSKTGSAAPALPVLETSCMLTRSPAHLRI